MAMSQAILHGTVTYDFARLMKAEGRTDVQEIKCSEFGTDHQENGLNANVKDLSGRCASRV
jgi:isocitrate dehydrogenase